MRYYYGKETSSISVHIEFFSGMLFYSIDASLHFLNFVGCHPKNKNHPIRFIWRWIIQISLIVETYLKILTFYDGNNAIEDYIQKFYNMIINVYVSICWSVVEAIKKQDL